MSAERTGVKVEAFEQFLRQLENRDRLFELIHGEIVEKMVTREHGILAANIATELNLYLRGNRIGRVAVETHHRPADSDENDRLPDVSVVCDMQRPVEREGAALSMPDLVVEIRSPDDSIKSMREKARFYLAHGSRMVGLVLPDKRLLEIYTPIEEQVLTIGDTLQGGGVLPGFATPVSHIFEM